MNRSCAQPDPVPPIPADEQLMWRVTMDGDAEAFARLVQRWETPIQRLCIRMAGDNATGEDIAQETFARVFARRRAYQPTGRFSTWLWRIALNLCHDHLRRHFRRNECSLESDDTDDAPGVQLATDEPAPDRQLESVERGELVRHALQRIPEHYRVVLILKHYENLKFREIADVLGIPEGTAKSRMAEGLSQLADLLANTLGPRAKSNDQLKEILMP